MFSRSYRNLGVRRAAKFRLLGLHPGRTFDVAAAAALLGVDASVAAGELVALTQAHLLTEPTAGRFEMHDLLRAYAREAVVAADDPAKAVRGLFDHYLHTANRADRLLTTQALRWLETELPNLVALCRLDDLSLDSRRWQLAFVLRGYFYLSKQLDSWIETHTHALAASVRAGDHRAEATTRNNLGMALVERGLLDQAMNHFQMAERLFEASSGLARRFPPASPAHRVRPRARAPAARRVRPRRAASHCGQLAVLGLRHPETLRTQFELGMFRLRCLRARRGAVHDERR